MMPKLERLAWLAPLSEGRGVTLTGDLECDRFLERDPNALLIGVLLDSQYPTRMAFASPLRLEQRLGHLDPARIGAMEIDALVAVFREKPALHRFPARAATLTQQLAIHLHQQYGGDSARLWLEARDVHDLGARTLALPAFGVEKTNWTIGMLGTLGLLPYDGWEEYRAPAPRRARASRTGGA